MNWSMSMWTDDLGVSWSGVGQDRGDGWGQRVGELDRIHQENGDKKADREIITGLVTGT